MYWYMEVMRKYAVFSGRARRTEYWMFQLVNIVIGVIGTLCVALTLPTMSRGRNPLAGLILVICLVYVLVAIVPSLAVSVRRLHDINFSGWWLLISLVPMGGLAILVFHLLDSTPGPNQYGPNPKGIGGASYAAQNAVYGMSAAAGAGASQPGNQSLLGFCNACGTQMQAGARFCPRCGKAAY